MTFRHHEMCQNARGVYTCTVHHLNLDQKSRQNTCDSPLLTQQWRSARRSKTQQHDSPADGRSLEALVRLLVYCLHRGLMHLHLEEGARSKRDKFLVMYSMRSFSAPPRPGPNHSPAPEPWPRPSSSTTVPTAPSRRLPRERCAELRRRSSWPERRSVDRP